MHLDSTRELSGQQCVLSGLTNVAQAVVECVACLRREKMHKRGSKPSAYFSKTSVSIYRNIRCQN